MRRAYGIEVLECPRCGGRMRLLATIRSHSAVPAILEHVLPANQGNKNPVWLELIRRGANDPSDRRPRAG